MIHTRHCKGCGEIEPKSAGVDGNSVVGMVLKSETDSIVDDDGV